MKKVKILVLMLLTFVFAFQATACVNESTAIDGPHMSERVYERMDEEAIYGLFDEIYALLETEGNRTAIAHKRDEFFNKYYAKTFTMNTLASINYDKDVASEYWQEESTWALTFAQKLQNDTLELEKAILSSPIYGDYFTSVLGEDYAASILVSETESEEQLALLAEIASLEADYSAKYLENNIKEVISIYIQLVNLRNRYAQTKKDKNGEYYKNYMDYAYAEVFGREYTPDEVASFRKSVKNHFASIRNKLYYNNDKNLSKDANVDTETLKNMMPEIINNTVPEMMSSWDYMMERELYDFEKSSHKANTSYVTSFYEYGDAFMFLDPSGKVINDLSTLIHEFGHYNENFMGYYSNPDLMSYDLAETHSQAFELITLPSVENAMAQNFDNQYLYKSYVYNLMLNSVWAVMSNCIFDEFEYIVYNTDPANLTTSFLAKTFTNSWNAYWVSGSSYSFYDITHFFAAPAYCISYSVSLVFSAVIWASDNPIENYVAVVNQGTGNTLSNVYTIVGLDNPLASNTVSKVASKITSFCGETFGW